MTIETYSQFQFEAAHKLPPFSGIHGHTFYCSLHMVGEPDPVFGWCADLYEVENHVKAVKEIVHEKFLNDIEGLEHPSIENMAYWLFDRFKASIPNLDRVHLWRGMQGVAEGCVCHGRKAPEAISA